MTKTCRREMDRTSAWSRLDRDFTEKSEFHHGKWMENEWKRNGKWMDMSKSYWINWVFSCLVWNDLTCGTRKCRGPQRTGALGGNVTPKRDGMSACIWQKYHDWLVVWNIFYFPINIGFLIIPTDFHIFQRGGPTTNQKISWCSQCDSEYDPRKHCGWLARTSPCGSRMKVGERNLIFWSLLSFVQVR